MAMAPPRAGPHTPGRAIGRRAVVKLASHTATYAPRRHKRHARVTCPQRPADADTNAPPLAASCTPRIARAHPSSQRMQAESACGPSHTACVCAGADGAPRRLRARQRAYRVPCYDPQFSRNRCVSVHRVSRTERDGTKRDDDGV